MDKYNFPVTVNAFVNSTYIHMYIFTMATQFFLVAAGIPIRPYAYAKISRFSNFGRFQTFTIKP